MDSLVPDWIQKKKAEQDRKAASDQTSALEKALSDKTIQADGPAYWKQLQKDLQITLEALAALNITGHISKVPPLPGHNEGIQIHVAVPNRNGQQYLNLYYANGGPEIERYPISEIGTSRMPFGVVRGNVVLYGMRDPLTPEQAAQFFIEPMVEALQKL